MTRVDNVVRLLVCFVFVRGFRRFLIYKITE